MELGKQIKKYRNELSLSQDELAKRTYVSRQTISNWENDKSYPDVKSLLLLGEVFNVSIDSLIKGDVEEMKEQVKAEDKQRFDHLGSIYSILMVLMIITPIPFMYFFKIVGIVSWIVIAAVTMYFAVLLENYKKQFNIQTYREIIAFMEGTDLDEISKAKEEGKRPYQKLLLAIGAGVIALIVTILMLALLVLH